MGLTSFSSAAVGNVAAAQWWVRVLWVSALSTMLGAVYHGAFDVSEQNTNSAMNLWRFLLVTIHVTGFFLCRSLACLCSPSRADVIVKVANVKLVLGCVVTVFLHSEIVIPIADYSFALVMWSVVSLHKLKSNWAVMMLLGVALSIAASAVQILKMKPSESFNHNDLYSSPFSRCVLVMFL